MRDSRAPSSMSGVSVALALVSDPFTGPIHRTHSRPRRRHPWSHRSLHPSRRARAGIFARRLAWRMAPDQPTSLLVERFDESVRRLSGESARIVNAGGRARGSRPRSFYVGHRLAWTCRGRVAVASEVSVARSRDTPWTLSSRSIDAEKPRHGQQAAARASRARFTRI